MLEMDWFKKKENPKQESWVDGYKKWKKNNVV